MTTGPQGPQEVSRKSKDVKEEDMEDGQNASKMQDGKVIDMGENPLTTLQILQKIATSNQNLLPTSTCHYKYYKSAISWNFNLFASC